MKVTQTVNGIPTAVLTTITHYDKTILVTTAIGVSGSGYSADHLTFTLPNGETYDSSTDELQVEYNGAGQHDGVEFDYEVSATATTIIFKAANAVPKDGRIRFIKKS